jgi:hypothetical protein
VRVLYTAKGVGRHEIVTEEVVTAKYGIPGRAYADFARGILAALDDPASDLGPRARLAAAREYLAVAPVVVRVATDAPLPDYDDRLPATPRYPERLVELADRHNLDGPLNRVLAALAKPRDGLSR